MVISREKTTYLKGIAIMMMLFLHLFRFNGDDAAYYKSLIVDFCIMGEPLAFFFANAANPNHIFLILSGYGLCQLYHMGKLTFRSQFKRIAKLYVTYWLITTVFVIIGNIVHPGHYIIDLEHVMYNLSGINTSYNHVAWFLFPYSMLALASPWVVPKFDVNPVLGGVISSLMFLVGGFIISNYMEELGSMPIVRCYFEVLYFTLSFYMGIILAKSYINFDTITPLLFVVLLVVAVLTEILINSAATYPLYSLILVVCFTNLNIKGRGKRFLITMGSYSMPMWFIHAFLCYFLLKDFLYSFRFPFAIFVLLLLISFSSAVPFLKISSYINNRLFK